MVNGERIVVGVPNEIKTHESRVALIPVGVEELTRAGHRVLVQAGAGMGSGISDEQYARMVPRSSPAPPRCGARPISSSRSRNRCRSNGR